MSGRGTCSPTRTRLTRASVCAIVLMACWTGAAPAATTLNTATGCADGTLNRTDFGSFNAGSNRIMSTGCAVTFGSDSGAAQLNISQQDLGGTAMRAAPSTGVIGHWPVNGGSLADLSPTNNPLGRAAEPASPDIVVGSSLRGDALNFNGDDIASATNHAAYDNLDVFTVDLWFRTSNISGSNEPTLIMREGAGPIRNFNITFVRSTGILTVAASAANGTEWKNVATAGSPYVDGQWHHVAATINGSREMRLYVDGIRRGGIQTFTGDIDNPTVPIDIGNYLCGTCDRGFSGDIDEVRVSNVARDDAQIRAIYEGTINDFRTGSATWTSGTTMFGACVATRSGAPGAGWPLDTNGACTATDADPWRAVPAATNTGDSLVASTTAAGNGTTTLVFGLRTPATQAPGQYSAPLVVDVIAPILTPPTNTTAPVATLSAREQDTLRTSDGIWSGGGPLAYTYQWQRCDAAGANCTDIPGATSAEYVAASDDVGARLRSRVTARNSAGQQTASSAAATATTVLAPRLTYAHEISSDVRAAHWRLNEAVGASAADSSGNGNNAAHIGGVTPGVAGLIAGDADKAADFDGIDDWLEATDSPTLSPTSGVTVEAWVRPTVSGIGGGRAIVGKTGTIHLRQESSADGSDFSFGMHDGTSMDPRVNSSIVPTPGQTYHVVGTFSNDVVRIYVDGVLRGQKRRQATFVDTAWPLRIGTLVGTGDPSPFAGTIDEPAIYGYALSADRVAQHHASGATAPTLPSITGTLREGQTLTATSGSWRSTPAVTYAYKWQRCDTGGASCVDATAFTASNTYVPGMLDVDGTMRAIVRATNSGGNNTYTTPVTGIVLPLAPSNTTPPAVTGIPEEGGTLTATGTWTSASPIIYTYQWQRCDPGPTICVNVGASTVTHPVVAADLGKVFRVVITATNSGGSSTLTSPATGPVTTRVPVGSLVALDSATVPAGWLPADGTAVTRAANPELLAALTTQTPGTRTLGSATVTGVTTVNLVAGMQVESNGVPGGTTISSVGATSIVMSAAATASGTSTMRMFSYGRGDGSMTFNVPDMQDRFAYGAGTNPRGATFGSDTHGHPASSVAHDHTVGLGHLHQFWNPAHDHIWSQAGGTSVQGSGGSVNWIGGAVAQFTNNEPGSNVNSTSALGATLTTSAGTATVATGGLPSFRTATYVIKASSTGTSSPCDAVWQFGASAAPAGARVANGVGTSSCSTAPVNRTTPDYRGRQILGVSATHPLSPTAGSSGGSLPIVHTVTPASHTHDVTMAAHSHDATIPGHSHAVLQTGNGSASPGGKSVWRTATGNTTGILGTPPSDTANEPSSAPTSTPAASPGATTAGWTPPHLALQNVMFTNATYTVPSGTITPFTGVTLPAGWLWAEGGTADRDDDAALFSALASGAIFGAGNGTTTFDLPDLTDRTPLGVSGAYPIGTATGTFGTHAHGFTLAGHDHDVNAAHTVNFNFTNHQHRVDRVNNSDVSGAGLAEGIPWASGNLTTDATGGGGRSAGMTTPTRTTSLDGGGSYTTNPSTVVSPPGLAIRFIIKR